MKGAKTGGRAKGTPNKATGSVQELLQRLRCDPFEGMARIANGDVPCGVCHGTGRTKFQPARGLERLKERTCESCYGSGKERLSPELRAKMYAELAQYVAPKRKAVEMTGASGGPMQARIEVVFVGGEASTGRTNGHTNGQSASNPG